MADAMKDDTEFGARKLSGVPMGLDETLTRLVNAANAKAAAPPELSSEIDNSDDVWRHSAALPRARREAFIAALEKATIDGELRLWLRLPDGRRFYLTSAEWRDNPFRREIVITGVWRDTLGGLTQYDGAAVMLDEAVFEAWRDECVSVQVPTPVLSEPSQSVSTEPLNTEPKTRHDRICLLCTERELPSGLQPAEVEKLTKHEFHARWPDETPMTIENRRTTKRAYEEYVASRSPK
jgi:hypothetical protein